MRAGPRAALVGALTVAALVGGCSTGADDPEPADPAGTAAAATAWSPCDGLTAAQVGRLAGEEMDEQ
ncbi:MAG TPA: hypothetical protein VD864_11270, partial [Nocardioides sp.]|nr:hypothetical protein [Nocardioides sp.]